MSVPSEANPEPQARGLCAHGLRYDPHLHRGCVLCRRNAGEVSAADCAKTAPSPLRFRSAVLLVLLLAAVTALAWKEFASSAAALPSSSGAAQQLDGVSKPLAPAAAHAPTPADESAAAPVQPLRVLFIGNSLTYVHEMPVLIAQLATAAGQPRAFLYRRETPGGFGFLEHLQTGGFRQLLAPGRFDFVVLQDQGQRPGWSNPQQREMQFNVPARRLYREVVQTGARPIFYETFARRDGDPNNEPGDNYAAMQQRISDAYANMARELHMPVVRVGSTWRAMHREHPEIGLWQDDGMHPTLAGAYLSACAFYAHFYDQSPLGNRFLAELPEPLARQLQTIAMRVWSNR